MIKLTEKGETVKLKKYTRKLKSVLMICFDFESILVLVSSNVNQVIRETLNFFLQKGFTRKTHKTHIKKSTKHT